MTQAVPEPGGRRPLQRHVLAEDVYEAVKALVMDHVIAPGARMSIDALARDLGVSQTPIRESLARLEADGLVTKQALRGYTTTPLLTLAELEDLFQLRRLLEPWGAAQAASRVTPAAARALRAELAAAQDIPDGPEYESYRAVAAHDARFHDLVLSASGSDAVRLAFERTHCHLHIFRLYHAQGIGGQAVREHESIVEAIADGDPDAAAGAMNAHLDASLARLTAGARR